MFYSRGHLSVDTMFNFFLINQKGHIFQNLQKYNIL
jgi:hypothetical protein